MRTHHQPEVGLNDALIDYNNLRLVRLSPATRAAHDGQLSRWRTWVVRETWPSVQLGDIDDRLMARYFDRLRGETEPSTYNNYRAYIRAFWDFCKSEGWVSTNPMRYVDPRRVPKRARLILSPDELLKILDDASPRDRIALAVGMNTALRAAEVTKLKIRNVNLGNDIIQVFVDKTDEEMILPVTAELRVELLRWLHWYANAAGVAFDDLPGDWTLIPPLQSVALNAHDNSLGRRVMPCPTRRMTHPERIVQAALERLGLPTYKEGFHTLRRSSLRALYDLAGAEGEPDPIRIAQAQAGHKNRQTTEGYLGISVEKKKRDDLMRGKSFLNRAVTLQQQQHIDEVGEQGGGRAAV